MARMTQREIEISQAARAIAAKLTGQDRLVEIQPVEFNGEEELVAAGETIHESYIPLYLAAKFNGLVEEYKVVCPWDAHGDRMNTLIRWRGVTAYALAEIRTRDEDES